MLILSILIMKQVIQNYGTGKLELAEVPVPKCLPDYILVKNVSSLISLGTERSVIELGKKNLIDKAKERPELVKRFFEKVKNEGFIKTFKEALERLDTPIPLGYSSSGVVVEVGENTHKFSPGDRVACIGAGFAYHGEYVQMPENLCCKMPNGMDFDEAAFGMLGTIALHGVRNSKVSFGESVAVIGLGILGLLTIQILKAYGCKVIGVDIDPKKVELAKILGVDVAFQDKISKESELELKKICNQFTNGNGLDSVILTLSTKESKPVDMAIDISKVRGRVVLVGVADIHPNRNEMWRKEVELMVSKAGGPGTLVSQGKDEEWTENKNLEEFLRLVSEKKVNVKKLITHRFSINEAEDVYRNVVYGDNRDYIGIVFEYSESSPSTAKSILLKESNDSILKSQNINVGVIGSGLFGKSVFLPLLKNVPGINLECLSTVKSSSSFSSGKRFGFKKCTTDYSEIINNKGINAVMILTTHKSHAIMVKESLLVSKHVYVEKPLCVNQDELKEIANVYEQKSASEKPFLMVGFNRRFSPHTKKTLEYISDRSNPALINYRINVGYLPPEHWVHSEEEGGSRIIGEICHFVDLIQYLIKSEPEKVYAEKIDGKNRTIVNNDNVVIVIKFKDGSIGNIFYTASGDRACSREQVEIFCDGKTIVVNDFKETVLYSFGKKKTFKTFNQEIGHKEEITHFFNVINGKEKPNMLFNEIALSTITTFKTIESLNKGEHVEISSEI